MGNGKAPRVFASPTSHFPFRLRFSASCPENTEKRATEKHRRPQKNKATEEHRETQTRRTSEETLKIER
jgi:hypothetical protein